MDKGKGRSTKLKVTGIILGSILLILAGVFAYGYSLLNRINQMPLVINEEENGGKKPTPKDMGISDEALKQKETRIVNILLMGIDRRSSSERGRSDTMLIASIDRTNEKVKLTSLMRDLYVSIPDRQDNRINAAYAFGGPALAIKTVNKNFDMNIEHYLALDLLGFEKIVDLIGGIEVDITGAESRIVGVSGSGRHLLDGQQALTYARIRRIGSDFQRTERQRTIMNEFFKIAMKSNILEIRGLLMVGFPHVETNYTTYELLKLGRDVLKFNSKEVKEYRLPVDGTYSHERIRGMAVLVPDLEKNRELLHTFIYR